MRPQISLRIAGAIYVGLGVMVWSVLWLAPEIGVPLSIGNSTPNDVITTARGWGDINGAMFCGLGMILFLCGGTITEPEEHETEVMKRVLLANAVLSLALLCFAVFHTVVLQHGPPPPLFLGVGGSLLVSTSGCIHQGTKKASGSARKKSRASSTGRGTSKLKSK
ncbi:unnamed protein product [Amoebophrya sp. A25]|nr:unnamed protein product [Amoebophrya sp. A25]|eukprot:GSA25T00011544001.1